MSSHTLNTGIASDQVYSWIPLYNFSFVPCTVPGKHPQLLAAQAPKIVGGWFHKGGAVCEYCTASKERCRQAQK